jgi:hypothetical protein
MADRMMFVGFNQPVRGMEGRAIDAFNDAVGLYGRMQQDGRIESFDVTLLDLNSDLGGYMQLHGSEMQIAALRNDEEFQRMLVSASMVVEGLRMVEGHTNEGIARQMAMFQEALAAAG